MYSNSKKQTLTEHSVAVASLSKTIFNKFFTLEKYTRFLNELDIAEDDRVFNYNMLENVIMNAALFHDLGKCDRTFQQFLDDSESSKFDPSKSLHNEVSFALLSVFKEVSSKYKSFHYNLIKYIVYWHHAKLKRYDDVNYDFNKVSHILESSKITFQDTYNTFADLVASMKAYDGEFMSLFAIDEDDSLDEMVERSHSIVIPEFQSCDFLKNDKAEKTEYFKNALRHLFRSIVVSADRIVSSLTADELHTMIQTKAISELAQRIESNNDISDLFHSIERMKEQYTNQYGESERSKSQEKAATDLSLIDDVAVLSGPAGVGKTKIMFEWIQKTDSTNKVFIIAPRQSVCESLYHEISSSYITDKRVEIITGERKERRINNNSYVLDDHDLFNSEINITTIDQILSMMMSHKKIDIFLEVLNSTLVFDEFHEFFNLPAIFMLFNQLVWLKRLNSNSHCLLMSATINHYMLKHKLRLSSKNIVSMKSFNETDYLLSLVKFDDKQSAIDIDNEMYESKTESQILIFNTATKAQVSSLKAISANESNTITYHSKLFRKDKAAIQNKIMKEFNKQSQERVSVLRTGPILQASFDISTQSMLTEISTIENMWQRLGRVVRFAEAEKGEFTIFTAKDMTKKHLTLAKSLDSTCCYNATCAFYRFIEEKLLHKRMYKLTELYDMYEDFFTREEVNAAYDTDYKALVDKSKLIFQQCFEPVRFFNKKMKKKTIAKKSLRNKSLYAVASTMLINNDVKEVVEANEDFNDNLITIDANFFYDKEHENSFLEEHRYQLSSNYKKSSLCNALRDNTVAKSYKAKKDFSKVRTSLLKDLARQEDTPLLLSSAFFPKHFSEDERMYNVIYNDNTIGLIKYKHVHKML
jgi:CRISPR-associated endonuclease/helicase Cas3